MRLSARIVKLELAEPFVIARDTTEVAEVVWVELEHEGERGFGEAAPNDRYDESAESSLDYIEEVAGDLGDDPFALDEIMERLPKREYAARAAIDAALHDVCGRLIGLPVWRMLGLRRAGPATSWTIGLGDPDEMARKAEKVTEFEGLKLKLGGRDGQDAERVRAVRAVWGDRSASTSTRVGAGAMRRWTRSRSSPSSASSTASSRCRPATQKGLS